MGWTCARGCGWRRRCVGPTRSLRPHCPHHYCCPEQPSLFHCHLIGCRQRPSCKLRHHGLIHQLPPPPLAARHCSLRPSPPQSLMTSCSAASEGQKNRYIIPIQRSRLNCTPIVHVAIMVKDLDSFFHKSCSGKHIFAKLK